MPTQPKPRRRRQGARKGPVRGQGDFKSSVKKLAGAIQRNESLFKTALKRLPSAASNPGRTASTLARGAARGALGAFLGSGDYLSAMQPTVNSLINPKTVSTLAEFSNAGRRGVRVIESEFLFDLKSGDLEGSSTLFTLQSYDINPSNSALFPWLSQFSDLFDQWLPNGIIFRFKSTSSEFNGASQALGTVVAAVDYDSTDLPYSTKTEMENSDYAVSCKASQDLLMGIECDPRERPTAVLYTGGAERPGAVPNLRNLGKFEIATVGMSAPGVTLGEVWVDYDITFYKKQLKPPAFEGSSQLVTGLETLAAGNSRSKGSWQINHTIAPISVESSGKVILLGDWPAVQYLVLMYYYPSETTWDNGHGHCVGSTYNITIGEDPLQFLKSDIDAGCLCAFTFTIIDPAASKWFQYLPFNASFTGYRTLTITPVDKAFSLT